MSEAINHTADATPSSRYFVRHHHPENGTLLGFWIYLMSDCLIFACLFACYAVLAATMQAVRPAPSCSTCRWWR